MTKQTLAPPPPPASTTMAPPELMDELVEEILLRLPLGDPASLVRAALVCKPWHRLIAAPGFRRRRFHQFHGAPPIVGFLCNTRAGARFLPTSSSPSPFRRPHGSNRFWRRAIDARHGRVLLLTADRISGERLVDQLAVWDPVTGDLRLLPTLGDYLMNFLSWSAAVLCAGDGSACNGHLDCHREPFQVVIVCTEGVQLRAYVYSSETAVWRQPASSWLQSRGISFYHVPEPSALVENALYFVSGSSTNLVKYNLASRQMSVIGLPPAFHKRDIVLTAREDGRRLGFAVVEGSKLYLWSRDDDAGPHGDAWWIQSRVIELQELFPFVDALSTSLDVVALIDGIGVSLVRMNDELFAINLKSSQVKKVCDVSGRSSNILPYTSFCMPALGAVSTADEGPRAVAPSSS